MVPADSPNRSLVLRALTRVPDLPRWIDTRGMLLSGRAEVATGGEPELSSDGFVVLVPDAALASIVGRPPANTIRDSVAALSGEVNVLSQMDDAEYAAAALPHWRRRAAVLHVLPETQPWEVESDPQARVFTRETAPRFDHLPEPLKRELTDALRGRTVSRFVAGELPHSAVASTVLAIPMAAAWTDGRPVSFCYPVWQTETLWDVAVDTWEPYQGQGLAGRAARAMITHMRMSGRTPVWGALDTNVASRKLAARLGFIEAAGIAVLTVR
jgi:RimJ/RimL family protein N-acetyltransferase